MKVEKIEFLDSGFQELLKSPEIKSFLEQTAQSRVSGSGNYTVTIKDGKKRSRAVVTPADKKTLNACYKENALVKLWGGGSAS